MFRKKGREGELKEKGLLNNELTQLNSKNYSYPIDDQFECDLKGSEICVEITGAVFMIFGPSPKSPAS